MSTTTPTRPSPLRVILLVIGSILLVGSIAYIVITAIAAASREDASSTISFADERFDAVDITAEVTDVVVEFADIDHVEVTFAQNDARRNMTFEAEAQGSRLVVTVVDHGQGWWMPFDFSESPRVTVVLPESFEGLDLTMETDVGDATISGDFANVELVGTVGDVRVSGSAQNAAFETTVGDLTAKRYTVDNDLTVNSSTGDVRLDLATVPSRVDVTSNVGDQTIVLPRGSYRVDTSTNVGDVRMDVESDPNSDTLVRLETTVGDITVTN